MMLVIGTELFFLAIIFLFVQPKKYSIAKYFPFIYFPLFFISSIFLTTYIIKYKLDYESLLLPIPVALFSIYGFVLRLYQYKKQIIKSITLKKEEINIETHQSETSKNEESYIPEKTLIFNDLKITIPANLHVPDDAERVTLYYNAENNFTVFVESDKVNKINFLNLFNTTVICLSALASPMIIYYEWGHKTTELDFSNSLGINLIFLAFWGMGMKLFSGFLKSDNKLWFLKILAILYIVFYYLEIIVILSTF
jgi:hypothetical protein